MNLHRTHARRTVTARAGFSISTGARLCVKLALNGNQMKEDVNGFGKAIYAKVSPTYLRKAMRALA
jgi:hypothetical protein